MEKLWKCHSTVRFHSHDRPNTRETVQEECAPIRVATLAMMLLHAAIAAAFLIWTVIAASFTPLNQLNNIIFCNIRLVFQIVLVKIVVPFGKFSSGTALIGLSKHNKSSSLTFSTQHLHCRSLNNGNPSRKKEGHGSPRSPSASSRA